MSLELAAKYGSSGVSVDEGELYIGGTAVTSSAAELNILDGVTATAAEINAVADASEIGGQVKVKKIAISATPTGSEQDTAWDLPAKAVVLDVYVDVTTAEATGGTKTIDVGLLSGESGGDADGFLDGVSVATTGIKKGAPTYHASGYVTGSTLGLLLAQTVVGSSTSAEGRSDRIQHVAGSVTAKSVSFTAGSNDFAEFRGAIYIVYLELGL
jgi:hypothetical protein